jgi:solute carrier family 25 oxoglutarate transporter 11
VNPFKIFRQIHETGRGLSGFYYGFDAALFSRLGYLFIRNFLYKTIYDNVKPVKPFNDLTLREKALLSGTVGGLAAFITSPFELA